MSKRINVNPDHYKVAGRARQGENIVHSTERRALARLRRQERLIHPFALETADQPAAESRSTGADTTRTETTRAGISNRESPDAEARERQAHPPVATVRRARPKRAAKGKRR